MSDQPKRPRGRPKGSALYTIQKHVFLDEKHVEMLRKLAAERGESESAVMRWLIRKAATPRKV